MRKGGRNVQPETLRGVLENYTVPNLRKLAGLVASGLPTRKAGLVNLLQKKLEDPDTLRQLWNELNDVQQAAVAEVVHSPSVQFDAAGFHAKYGQDPDWGTRRYRDFEKLTRLCLFIHHGRIPRDLKARLKEFVPPPRAARIQITDEPPAAITHSWYDYQHAEHRTYEVLVIQRQTERAARHDVHAVLRLIETDQVSVSDKTKLPLAAGIRAVAEVLQGGDFYPPEEEPHPYATEPEHIKAFAWPLIVLSAGLATLSGRKLQLTPAGKKALSSPPEEVIDRAWKRWLKTTLLDEFNRIDPIKGQTGKGKRGMTAVAGRRAVVAEALAACPPHEWIEVDEFWRFMRASGYSFEVARDLWSLYIGHREYGSLGYAGFGKWEVLQGRYILAFLFEYTATLGLIDVAYIHPSGARNDYGGIWGTDDLDCLSRYDGLLYFRINGLGAWCLGLTQEYQPSPRDTEESLKVLPNLEVVATEPLPPGDVLFLELFAEPTSDVVWKIETTKVLEAVEQGYWVSEIEAFLRARAGGSLPDNVVTYFKEQADRVSRLADCGQARLIEVEDPALAQLIVNNSRLQSLCMLAGERYIVVPAENESAFRRALHELGYALPISQVNQG